MNGLLGTDKNGNVTDIHSAAVYPGQLQKMMLPKYHEITTDLNLLVKNMRKTLEKGINVDGVKMYRVNGKLVAYTGDVIRDGVNHYVNDVFFKPLSLRNRRVGVAGVGV